MSKTYYDELKLARDANAPEIKRQYRVLALKYHPDTPGGSDAAFMKVQAAYDVLSDLDKRVAYDKELAKADLPTAAAAAGTAATSSAGTSTPPPTANWSAKATRKTYPPPPRRPTSGFRWRWTFYQTLVAVMVAAILILVIRVGTTWSGGIGVLATPALGTPELTPTPTPTPSPSPTSFVTPDATDEPVSPPLPSPTPFAGMVPTVTPVPSVFLSPTPATN